MALKQATRFLSLKTPLGDDVLLLTGFTGQEQMSRLFSFQLDLISDRGDITAQEIVGKNVTFSVKLQDQSERFFNGFVSRFAAGDEEDGRRNYRAEVVPWLWFLTRTADCRIFQNKKLPEIIEQIFGDLGFSDFETGEIKGDHKKWEYCVQYRETDFNFVSRLMEQEGMFYYFRHEDGKHIMVIGDQAGAYRDCKETQVDYPYRHASQAVADHITWWEHQYEFRPGKWAQTDFNFKTPSTSLMTNVGTILDLPGTDKYEIYDYPGEYAARNEGETETKLRMEEHEVDYDVVRASSQCKSFTPGGKFGIGKHRSASEEGKQYVITSISHRATEPLAYEVGQDVSEDYRNEFACIPAATVFRPARITPRATISGVQTAIVVGPPGEEIHVDEFARVKVRFHWDREAKNDDNDSCWIRVSQTYAGAGWGNIMIPRVGQEVIVDFLEGDPDRPVITGRLYHAENKPPFPLPGSKTISGMKSKTYKGDGYNEFIMDDTPGKELIRVHAQYDMATTVEHDDSLTVHNDRTITVDGTHLETIKGDTKITVTKGHYVHDIATGTAKYHVQSDLTEKYDGNQTTNVALNQKTEVGNLIDVKSEKGHIHLKAATEIQLWVGSSKLLMKSDGSIELSGINIGIDGKSKVNIHGGDVSSAADGSHMTEGGLVMSSAGGANTVKGSTVLLNP